MLMFLKEKAISEQVSDKTKEFEDYLYTTNQIEKGQVFTPLSIAQFMAKQFQLSKDKFYILDPGAGTGILSAALCERIINTTNNSKEIELVAYENDNKIIPVLHENLLFLKRIASEYGHEFNFSIKNNDFVAEESQLFNDRGLFQKEIRSKKYNLIISNPPYYKLRKSDRLAKKMDKIVYGQPNIYSFFMALSAKMLCDDGEMVFITPRSFCSGLYFKKFRRWLLKEVTITKIHSFKSRDKTFDTSVLQETIISKFVKSYNKNDIIITHSDNANFTKLKKLSVKKEIVIDPTDQDKIIQIPSNKRDISIINTIRKFKNNFIDLGYKISTGPVVKYRAKEYLSDIIKYDGESSIPLIWMHHFQDYHVKFPNLDINKPQILKITENSKKYVLINQNYVLVKRFSSKEQKRRVYAAVYDSSCLDTKFVTFENHINFIWKPGDTLSKEEIYGIMAILNSTMFDNYFRVINGNTQVNAGEINNMPFPSKKIIKSIGYKIINSNKLNQKLFDRIVSSNL